MVKVKKALKKDSKQFEPVAIHGSIVNEVDRFDLKEVEYDTLVQMGIEVSEAKIYAQWVLGKLGDTVATKYGDLEKYSKEVRQNRAVMDQYMFVYRKFMKEDPTFTPQKYYGSVPWGVLQIAAYKSDNPQDFIEDLRDKGAEVSIESAHRANKEKETGESVPMKPRIGLKWNEETNKYKIKLDLKDFDLIDWADIKAQLMDYLEGLK